MSNIIMNIMGLTQFGSAAELGGQQVAPKEGPSFSQYVEQKCAELGREGKNMLGVKHTNDVAEFNSETIFLDPKTQIDTTTSDFLQQLMAKLKELAQDTKDMGAGAWQLPKLEPVDLEKLAETAGMDPAVFGILNLKMEEQNAPLPLMDLFTSLEKHFLSIDNAVPVTAPETSLPLLMSFLEKMGIPAEKVGEIAESSVNEFGEFDLGIFLDELERGVPEVKKQPQAILISAANQQQVKLPGGENQTEVSLASKVGQAEIPLTAWEVEQLQDIPLTAWEVEQLQDMLATAGLSKEMQKQLFPKDPALMQEAFRRLTGKDLPVSENKTYPTTINVSQLKEMLQHTIKDADLAAPKVDLPQFISQLEGLVSQAGFKEEGVGFTPLVQGSVTAIFQELQKIIDQSKIRIEKSPSPMVQEGFVQELPSMVEIEEGEMVISQLGPGVEEKVAPVEFMRVHENNEVQTPHGKSQTDSSFGLTQQVNSEVNLGSEAAELKATGSRLRMSPEMQQFTLDQISQTVARGLKNSQHHLTLTLYPKEMGEVKVDMQVRDNQVSLSFLMENPKVKELLEGNMQEFKNSMEQRGFVLQGCDVSVGQHGREDESQKQFELVKTWQNENTRKATMEEVSELLTAGQTARLSYHDGVINMMV